MKYGGHMKRVIMRKIVSAVFISTVLLILIFWRSGHVVYAKDETINVSGELYEFDEKAEYIFSSDTPVESIKNAGKLGAFSISGDIKSIPDVNGFTAYQVQHTDVSDRKEDEGIVKLSYVLGNRLIGQEETDWHIVEDKTTKVNGEKLDEKVLSGAIILQTSLDGETWVTDITKTNIADEKSEFESSFYETKGIHQVNGCFYRVAIVYKTEKRLPDTKLGPITQKHYEYKKYAEIYEFYLIDSLENMGDTISPTATPRKELGKRINTGKDNGFSENNPEQITDKDPHFGWDIGTFYLNGYTREQMVSGSEEPIFLKTLGDRVTLWFNLKEDINSLNGNDDLCINEDKNGYDQYFGVEKGNFKHGTLIIQFTDFEGRVHEPIIYTDYLAASAKTGANTKVELFEEGDYEVALDYEIKDSSGIVDSYTNYRISFNFKIRNGNCMVYPFDVATGNELSDKALTENGFKLDLAKSRYLTIDIEREAVREENGRYLLDKRANTAAQEGTSYTTEGIYTFTVKNPSTGDSTTKTIYVGTSPVYKALAGKTVEDVNELLDQGGQIQEDGTIIFPSIPDEPEEIVEVKPEEVNKEMEKEEEPKAEKAADETIATMSKATETETESEPLKGGIVTKQEEAVSPNIFIYVVAGGVVAAIILLIIGGRKNREHINNIEGNEMDKDDVQKEDTP